LIIDLKTDYWGVDARPAVALEDFPERSIIQFEIGMSLQIIQDSQECAPVEFQAHPGNRSELQLVALVEGSLEGLGDDLLPGDQDWFMK
jgi:hypothetical protein